MGRTKKAKENPINETYLKRIRKEYGNIIADKSIKPKTTIYDLEHGAWLDVHWKILRNDPDRDVENLRRKIKTLYDKRGEKDSSNELREILQECEAGVKKVKMKASKKLSREHNKELERLEKELKSYSQKDFYIFYHWLIAIPPNTKPPSRSYITVIPYHPQTKIIATYLDLYGDEITHKELHEMDDDEPLPPSEAIFKYKSRFFIQNVDELYGLCIKANFRLHTVDGDEITCRTIANKLWQKNGSLQAVLNYLYHEYKEKIEEKLNQLENKKTEVVEANKTTGELSFNGKCEILDVLDIKLLERLVQEYNETPECIVLKDDLMRHVWGDKWENGAVYEDQLYIRKGNLVKAFKKLKIPARINTHTGKGYSLTSEKSVKFTIK